MLLKLRKKLTIYIGVAKIFDCGGRPNCKSHAMTSTQFLEKRNFLWDKNTAEWRIRNRGLGWHATWILLKTNDLNQKLKRFSQLFKLGDDVKKLVQPKLITNRGVGAVARRFLVFFFGKK